MPEWVLDYVDLGDGEPLDPPNVEVDISSPSGELLYVCLVDSGASLSLFPDSAAVDFGLTDEDLGDLEQIATAGAPRPARRVKDHTLLAVVLEGGTRVPIAPYFASERDPASGEAYVSMEAILGRDFLLGLEEVAFRQSERVLVIRDGHA